MAKKTQKVGLLAHMTFDKEARDDGQISPAIEGGRIRYFFALFSKHNGDLLLPSLLFLISAIPLFGSFIFFRLYGPERLLYAMLKITKIPYLMTNVGIGISAGADVVSLKADMLMVYQLLFVAIGIGVFFMSIGLSGMLRLSAKFIWKDSFITKRDTYGNHVPRTVVEFFEGVKKCFPQMLVWGAIAMIFVAGVGNAIVYFVQKLWSQTVGGGDYVLLILACIIGVFSSIFLLYLAPFIVMYDMPFFAKVKNPAILTIQMFVPNIFILAVVAIPLIIVAISGGFINVIFVALLIVFGASFYSLLTTNYVQYYAEKIINPIYSAQVSKKRKKKKK